MAEDLTELLRRVAARSEGLVELEPGLSEERMDAWPVPVPPELRALFRETAGMRIAVSPVAANGYVAIEHISFDHPYNSGGYHGADVSWYQDHAGGPDSHRFLYTDTGDGHVYVDVDRESGAWGPVFEFWDATDTQRIAPSLDAWLRDLAGHVEAALTTAGTEPRAFGREFLDRWHDSRDRPTRLTPVPVTDARESTDPLLREVAARLPDTARLVDLRTTEGLAFVDFRHPVTCRYTRHANGTILAATPWTGE
ncbi:SMI1/KNR4 family protein [Kitasatospora camelliae]|uniref:SMI1/KNR4 family protein n=1 Tax=Kitasatospora camelliae TaxID=3156397 RepID=A0AAU8K383_9ACTN